MPDGIESMALKDAPAAVSTAAQFANAAVNSVGAFIAPLAGPVLGLGLAYIGLKMITTGKNQIPFFKEEN